MSDDEGLTYAAAGVDVEASEAATAALLEAAATGDADDRYAGVLEVGDLRIGLTTDGVGTKLLVAEAVGVYDTIGIDCVAMNVNDLVAAGLRPIGFVDYLALEAPDEDLTAALGVGLAEGAERADVALMGGETAVLPEVVDGFDLAGAAIGIADGASRLPGIAEPGDALVGVPASGVHSNGLTLARQAIARQHTFDDPFPPAPARSIAEELLRPTRIYTPVVDVLQRGSIRACAHVTGGGLRNLSRMGQRRYVVDAPPPVPDVFPFIQACGDVDDAEMYRTFNMGIGFVLAVEAADAEAVAAAVDGTVIGHVEAGSGITIRGLELHP